jgi:hypothetical protein
LSCASRADNRLNGVYCSEHAWLLNQVLRQEWNFRGLTVSDWGGTNVRAAGVRNGGDLEMPGSAGLHDKLVARAVQRGLLSMEALEEAASRVAALILASNRMSGMDGFRSDNAADDLKPTSGSQYATQVPPPSDAKAAMTAAAMPSLSVEGEPAVSDGHVEAKPAVSDGHGELHEPTVGSTDRQQLLDRHHDVARRAALSCAVLLKNEGAALPLRRDVSSICLIGGFAVEPRYQGAGSSHINAPTIDKPLAAVRSALGRHAAISADEASRRVTYCAGYDAAACVDNTIDAAAIDAAVTAATAVEVVVLLVGLPSAFEAEGIDREHMCMPKQMIRLIAAVGAANPKTTMVLMGGAPVEVRQWRSKSARDSRKRFASPCDCPPRSIVMRVLRCGLRCCHQRTPPSGQNSSSMPRASPRPPPCKPLPLLPVHSFCASMPSLAACSWTLGRFRR